MSSSSFARMATVPFTTRRNVGMVGGKQAGPQPYLVAESLRCTPLDPADPGGKGVLVERLILESTVQLLETLVAGDLDIREGDLLVVAGVDYTVMTMGLWAWRGSTFRYLILEDTRRALR